MSRRSIGILLLGILMYGVKAFERAGADQILFAGAIRVGTEPLERAAALLSF